VQELPEPETVEEIQTQKEVLSEKDHPELLNS
jgi:hypothetical protein